MLKLIMHLFFLKKAGQENSIDRSNTVIKVTQYTLPGFYKSIQLIVNIQKKFKTLIRTLYYFPVGIFFLLYHLESYQFLRNCVRAFPAVFFVAMCFRTDTHLSTDFYLKLHFLIPGHSFPIAKKIESMPKELNRESVPIKIHIPKIF